MAMKIGNDDFTIVTLHQLKKQTVHYDFPIGKIWLLEKRRLPEVDVYCPAAQSEHVAPAASLDPVDARRASMHHEDTPDITCLIDALYAGTPWGP
jgi:hypothetical protein